MKLILNYPIWVCHMFSAGILTNSTSYFTGGDLVTKSCLTLATPWTVSCQDPLTMGFFQTRILEWVEFPSPGNLPDPIIEPGSAALQVGFFFLPTELPQNSLILQGDSSFFLPFWPHHTVYGILVLWVRIKPVPLEVEVWSLNCWTMRQVPRATHLTSHAFPKR